MGDITPRFDPNAFRDKVTQRIKDNFADLIPEESLNALVREVTDNFLHHELKKIIREEVDKVARAEVAAEMGKLPSGFFWHGGQRYASPNEAMVELFRQLLPDILAASHGAVVQDIAMQLQQKLRGY